MQRLDDTDIFLRPDGAGSRICRFTADGIVEGSRVSLSPMAPMSISADGWCAAVASKGRRIWTARITETLQATEVKSTLLPKGTVAHSIAVRDDRLFVGGIWERPSLCGDRECCTWLAEGRMDQSPAALEPVPMPEDVESVGKPIDDLLLLGEQLLAVDNLIFPKWVLVYDLSASSTLRDARVADLVTHHSYEHVRHGAAGRRWYALLSTSVGRGGAFRHLAFYDSQTMVEVCQATFRVGETGDGEGFTSGFAPMGVTAFAPGWEPADAPCLADFVPEQVACVNDCFFVLGQDGRIALLDLSDTEPEGCSDWNLSGESFELVSCAELSGGPPTMLVAVPKHGAVIAANPEGQMVILGGEGSKENE